MNDTAKNTDMIRPSASALRALPEAARAAIKCNPRVWPMAHDAAKAIGWAESDRAFRVLVGELLPELDWDRTAARDLGRAIVAVAEVQS